MTENDRYNSPLRVGLVSLGCAKNLVDAEIMLGTLLTEGVEITNDPAGADVVIVNTCSFIDAAQAESVDAILELAAVRDAQQRGQALVVAGCLSQRFREELPKLLPEVDAIMGLDQVREVASIARQALTRRAARNSPQVVSASKAQSALFVDRGAPSPHPSPPMRERVPASTARKEGRVRGNRGSSGVRRSERSQNPPRLADLPLVHVQSRPTYIPDYATPRFRLTPRHFAYLKIAEGCNHPCSFCVIPQMRGGHRSRVQSDIVAEARQLIADGVKELNLISQDTTYYGLDLQSAPRRNLASPDRFQATARALPAEATTLSTLLRALDAIPGDFWIRLLYTHPAHWTDELIETVSACPKVARYVDLPLQHIHDLMLERMRRETSRAHIEDLIRRLRTRLPGLTLRTTFIVGFPGETEAAFAALLEFIQATRFERLGVFTYSREEGTRAGRMKEQVPDKIKRRRRDRAMAVQREVARAAAAAQVGQTARVLVESDTAQSGLPETVRRSWEHGLIRAGKRSVRPQSGRYSVARGTGDAPDIDGRVYVQGTLPTGEFAPVRIVNHTDYDLLAEPVL